MTTSPIRLDYEKLDVYQASLEFLDLALQLIRTMPRGDSDLRSQLRRAAMSIPLNIAEATGKPTLGDRARYHAIARGSAMECGAIVDVCVTAGYVSAVDAQRGKELVGRMVAMLSKMCR